MKRIAALLLFVAGCAPALERHARYLASEECDGRETGTEGERRAGEYIAAEFRKAGLEPVFQEFEGHGAKGRNVIGRVRGSSDECVVIGAHYDHLGRRYPGADDNASGTSVLLELAGRFARRPAGRGVVFAAFSGEEMGCFGSRHYVKHPVVPLDKTVAMINMDMVGRLRDQLIVFGADTGDRFKEYMASAPIRIAHNRDPVGPSDHTSFYVNGVPAVHLFTGAHADYHKPGDTADKLEYGGMARIADLVEMLARRIADAPERMKFQKVEVAELPKSGGGATPYFGSMPDYAYDGKGVRLSAVTPESPAEKAGLREGDILVSFNGQEIMDVKQYASLLFARKPGEVITVAFERDGKRSDTKATLAAKKKPIE